MRNRPKDRFFAPFWLTFSTASLFLFGLVMVYNTTSAVILDRALDVSMEGPLLKQILYALIGMGSGFFLYSIGYERLLSWGRPLWIFGIFLLLLVFVPGIGQASHGARRWIGWMGVSFQPSEMMKILLPLFWIQWAAKGEKEFRSLGKQLGWTFLTLGLILVEPDNGTTFLLGVELLLLLFLLRVRLLYWALPLLILVGIGGAVAYQMPHVHDRVRIYLHPELDLKGKGHQPHQAKIAAGSGKLWGRGLGGSLQKLNYLPEARSDYIAAIWAEETGFIGVLGLLALYLLFISSGFLIAWKAADRGGFYLAVCLTFVIGIQAFLNLGVVSGLLPSKGMTLPFFSQGGTSLMSYFMILFLLLDVERKGRRKEVC